MQQILQLRSHLRYLYPMSEWLDFFKKGFIYITSKVRERERVREIFHLIIHSSNVCNDHSWACLKLEAKNFQSPMCMQGLENQAMLHYFPRPLVVSWESEKIRREEPAHKSASIWNTRTSGQRISQLQHPRWQYLRLRCAPNPSVL